MSASERVTLKAALVSRAESIGDFAARMGLAIYGDWFATLQDSIKCEDCLPGAVGDDSEIVTLVREQVRAGLARGIVVAGANFDESGLRIRRAAPIEDDGPEPDDGFPWLIAKDFWNVGMRCGSLSWGSSTAVVSLDMLVSRDRSGCTAASLIRSPPKELKVNIAIIDPDIAMRSIARFEDMPSRERIAEYRQFISLSINAAIAAAWRYIAVRDLDFSHGDVETLINEIDDYLLRNHYKELNAERDSEPTRKTISAIVTKIARQWRTLRDDTSLDHKELPVLINSTPENRARRCPPLF